MADFNTQWKNAFSTRLKQRIKAAAIIVLTCLFVPLANNVNADTSENNPLLGSLEWRFVGPYRGSRVVAVAGVPDDPLTYYFGSAHAGVWKTEDAGLNWHNISDDYIDFPSVGGMDVSLSDPNVIYVGTGEGLQRQYISPGNGVYKSEDAGKTWQHMGLAATRHISRVRIHPTNPDVALVAAMGDMFGPNEERGIYRTTNGGKSWKKVLYVGETTGAVDVAFDHQNPNIILAAMNHHVTYPWDEESGGPTSGLFRSTDGGDTWENITKKPGMPKAMVGKIGIAISPVDGNRIYLFVEADLAKGGIYRSSDGGENWKRVHYNPAHLEIPNSYNHITADVKDPDTVYIQPIAGFLKSTDGGETFERIRLENWDPHALWINPNNADIMIEGGDGGASVSLNGGKTWSPLENQPTADLLSLAVDDQEPYVLYGSQNDNSHIMIPSRGRNYRIDWSDYLRLPAGEGGHTAVKPDGSVVYANDRSRMARIDQKTGIAQQVSVWPEWVFGTPAKHIPYRFYYSFPVLLSPHNDGVLYTAAQYLFRSTDEGQTWQQISNDLTKNRTEVMGETSGGPISSNASSLFHTSVIRTIAESPITEGELWIGTDDSTVQMSRDGGKSWHDVSPPMMPEWTTVTAIDVSNHSPGTAYVSGGRHRVSDRTPYLFKTTDYGQNWSLITDGIHANDFTWVIREDPVRDGLLYAGAETGAYVSFNGGAQWQSLQKNLPPTIVMQMQVKNDDLVIATHGRGFWIMDNISALRQMAPDVTSSKAHLFDIQPALRLYGEGKGWATRDARHYAKNPPYGVVIDYYLKDAETTNIALTIKEESGAIIKSYSDLKGNRGLNRFVWDMRYPGTEMPVSPGALDGYQSVDYSPPSAPTAAPGEYYAELIVGGQNFTKPFTIVKDPKISASNADLKAQFDLSIAIRDQFAAVSDTIMQIRDVRKTLQPLDAEKTEPILSELRKIEGILTIWMGSKEHPMMWSAPGLTEKFSTLNGAVSGSGARPTKSMYAVFEDMSERLERQKNRLNSLIRIEVNPLLKEAN